MKRLRAAIGRSPEKRFRCVGAVGSEIDRRKGPVCEFVVRGGVVRVFQLCLCFLNPVRIEKERGVSGTSFDQTRVRQRLRP